LIVIFDEIAKQTNLDSQIQKIEEMILYIIELKKENKALRNLILSK
jgi:hypothetical protein